MSQATRVKLEKERERVFHALESAARMVGERDRHILENDLRKEAIVHRLAYYLEENLFTDRHLDLDGVSGRYRPSTRN